MFDQDNANEDDIFAFSGYVKPGRHTLVIFDPVSKSFFEISNLIIEQRKEDVHNNKETALVSSGAFFDSSTNFKAVQSAVYGGLLDDPSW